MSVNYPTAGYSWEYWYRPGHLQKRVDSIAQ